MYEPIMLKLRILEASYWGSKSCEEVFVDSSEDAVDMERGDGNILVGSWC